MEYLNSGRDTLWKTLLVSQECGWGGVDLWELLSFRKQASPPWAGAKAGSRVGLSKANCQQQLGGPFFLFHMMLSWDALISRLDSAEVCKASNSRWTRCWLSAVSVRALLASSSFIFGVLKLKYNVYWCEFLFIYSAWNVFWFLGRILWTCFSLFQLSPVKPQNSEI